MTKPFGISCFLARRVVVFALCAGFASVAALSGESGSSDKVERPEYVIILDPREAGEASLGDLAEALVARGFKGVVFSGEEGGQLPSEDELRILQDKGMELAAVAGPLDQWAPLIEELGVSPQVWLSLEDRRQGLHYQKVRASGRALLQVVRQAHDLGLEPAIVGGGEGWKGEAQTLLDVADWVNQYSRVGEVGLVYRISNGEEMDDLRRSIDRLGREADTLVLSLASAESGNAADGTAFQALVESGFEGRVALDATGVSRDLLIDRIEAALEELRSK